MVIYSIHLKHWSGGSVPHSLIKGWRFNPSPLIHWYVSGVPNQLTKDWGFETDIFLKVQAMQGSGYVSCLHRLSFVKKKKSLGYMQHVLTHIYVLSSLASPFPWFDKNMEHNKGIASLCVSVLSGFPDWLAETRAAARCNLQRSYLM